MDITQILAVADIVVVNERGLKHIPSRLLGRTPWHHIMLYIGDGKVIDVTPLNGCHIADLKIIKEKYFGIKIFRNENLDENSKQRVVETAKVFLGKGFSWSQVIRGIARFVFRSRSKNRNSRVQLLGSSVNISSSMCTNFVAMTYYFNGCSISERYLPEYAMPKDFEKPKKFSCVIEKRFC